MSGYVEESETARKLQLYATSIYQVHSFVCQLDYTLIILLRNIVHEVKYYQEFRRSDHGTLGADFEYVTFLKGPQPTTQDQEKTVNKTK